MIAALVKDNAYSALIRNSRPSPMQRRSAAEFADRIARGAQPSDIPVKHSTQFTLRITKILGITSAPTFLAAPTR
jgi:hypothetical protein